MKTTQRGTSSCFRWQLCVLDVATNCAFFQCLQCTLQCVMLHVMIPAKLLATSRMRMSICVHVAETWVGGQCRSTCTRARERHIRLIQLVKVNLFQVKLSYNFEGIVVLVFITVLVFFTETLNFSLYRVFCKEGCKQYCLTLSNERNFNLQEYPTKQTNSLIIIRHFRSQACH